MNIGCCACMSKTAKKVCCQDEFVSWRATVAGAVMIVDRL